MQSTADALLLVPLGHVINVSAGWFIHHLLHRRVFGIPFYLIHMVAHHRIDYDAGYRLNLFSALEHVTWMLMIGMVCLSYYLVFPHWAATFLTAQTIIYTLLTYYLHREFDDRNSWLGRYSWFRKGQQLHGIHHGYAPSANAVEVFSRSVNYGFGGPLIGHFPDRLLGTYRSTETTSNNEDYECNSQKRFT